MEGLSVDGAMWCAFALGKEAWKCNGNFYTADELKAMDQIDDFSISEPMEITLSAD